MTEQHPTQAAPAKGSLARWNRTEVNRYLLPVLRHVDQSQNEGLSPEERAALRDHALRACTDCPEAYAQMARVYNGASAGTKQMWFGWIECEGELLDRAFDFIGRALRGDEQKTDGAAFDYEKDMYFASLFRINDGDKAVDLSQPFEQFYFCDETIYRDYLYRRLELGEKCKAWVRHYLPYYNRIRAWYRENLADCKTAVRPEFSSYMELLEHWMKRIVFEDRLRDDRAALEYERGGLGWFRGRRKREIDAELYRLTLEELNMQIEDAQEKYDAYEAQFLREREAWQNELESAPVTAFGRRKELKQKLSELEEKLQSFRGELALDELREKYRKMTR